jgi:hypothetical protein
LRNWRRTNPGVNRRLRLTPEPRRCRDTRTEP